MRPEPVRGFRFLPWIPAVVLALGILGLTSINRQIDMPLVRPLAEALPGSMDGVTGTDQIIKPEELAVSGVSQYIFRWYGKAQDSLRSSVYVGYYESQTRGKTIHSPKNCLPGAGWEPLESGVLPLEVKGYRFSVNRYVLENRGHRALVYYWYQGRGRISSNEYYVKWEQIRDRALLGRSDEALVRVLVPVPRGYSMQQADSLAVRATEAVVGPLSEALPGVAGRPLPGATSGT